MRFANPVFGALVGFVASLVFLAWFSQAASAGVSVSPQQLTAGRGADVGLVVTNDQAAPITRFVINADEGGVTDANAQDVAGWSSTLERNDDGSVKSLEWSRGSVPVGQTQTFTAYLVVAASAPTVPLNLLTASSDGEVQRDRVEFTVAGANAGGVAQSNTTESGVTSTSENATGSNDSTDADSQSRLGLGMYLIAFGVAVLLFVYVRGKKLAKQGSRERKQ